MHTSRPQVGQGSMHSLRPRVSQCLTLHAVENVEALDKKVRGRHILKESVSKSFGEG